MKDYLKISKAPELTGRERRLYRFLEILPGALSWLTIIALIIFSYYKPVGTAIFVIMFDVYWLLLVAFLGTHLLISYRFMKKRMAVNWQEKCESLGMVSLRLETVIDGNDINNGSDSNNDNKELDTMEEKTVEGETGEIKEKDKARIINLSWRDVVHVVILPTYQESLDVLRSSFNGLVNSGYQTDKLIVVLAAEARAGEEGRLIRETIGKEYGHLFRRFLITIHPDDIIGELKGKGANQAWAAKKLKEEIIDGEEIDYASIMVSVLDSDTVVFPGYFYCLTHAFLTSKKPYRSSYQPIPVYHNNMWQAPFFARVAAFSNTFWQMMQQLRPEKSATYSSHAMTWQSLIDIDFWSTNMVSEDSRIFWHCFCYYQGDYRVEPLYFPVSMDMCMDKNQWQSAKNLYRQQRRWGWGVENIPYLVFNTIKQWPSLTRKSRGNYLRHIGVQIYGFHSWATNALITSIIGWLPLILGGSAFNATVLSSNLPMVTKFLMTLAMVGMVLSAIVSLLMLPTINKKGFMKYVTSVLQWICLPIVIIVFGSIPGLEAQTRLMLGKYMGFWVTPKHR
ncbi:MAG: glycosyltransferase family 2 protein [Patescibacteria group bacterium]|nr:MAG: glycosyltransferase family 2 protein [Patescibacteria group bacterium]